MPPSLWKMDSTAQGCRGGFESPISNSQPGSYTQAKSNKHMFQFQSCHLQYSKSSILRVDGMVCLFVGCLTSQQQASVSQGRICSDNFTCCHTEIEVADQTFYLTQSQYTDIGPTSPSADPITPGAWLGSHWCANFEVTGMTQPRKNPGASGI